MNIERSKLQNYKDFTKKYYSEFKVPVHVQKHMITVAIIAEAICETISSNKENILKASLIHDCLRIIDFRDYNPEKFIPKPKKEQIQLWEELREEYMGQNHAEALAEYILKTEDKELSQIIKHHDFKHLQNLETIEEEIVFYADKRVNNYSLVSLKERFAEGKKRNSSPLETENKFIKQEKKVYLLEDKLNEISENKISKLIENLNISKLQDQLFPLLIVDH